MRESEWNAEISVRQRIHNHLVKFYCAIIFMLKNQKTVRPILLMAFKRLFSRKKYIFHLATPTHDNRGDQMIVFAMKKWCEKYFPDYVYLEYDDGIYKDWSYFSLLKMVIRKRDFIFLRGGGSVGDWYLGYEYFIRHVLESYPNNKIVMFPQSVNFSNTPKGIAEKNETARVYDSHGSFIMNTRDEMSYHQAKEMFHHCKVRLCPDIAMFLIGTYQPMDYERNGVLLCLRCDENEIFYNQIERRKMITHLESKYSLHFGDTGAGHSISADKREEEIKNLLELFSRSQVAVTDRFHGIISAVLTKTPCVALRSADHKIPAGIKWFSGVNYVFYADTIEEVPTLVEKAFLCANLTAPDFSKYFELLYKDIMNG